MYEPNRDVARRGKRKCDVKRYGGSIRYISKLKYEKPCKLPFPVEDDFELSKVKFKASIYF